MSSLSLVQGERVAKRGIINLALLGCVKLIAGLLTGMTVIIADAISTFADISGLFASYLGLKLSRKSADREFEYGYYKIETFAAFIVSLGIIVIGSLVLIDSINTFIKPQEGSFRIFAVIVTVIAIVNSLLLSKKLAIVAAKTNSLSLLANAKEKKIDVIAGFGVILSIAANYQGIPYIEGVVSGIIALIILFEGVTSSKESLFFLLDYWNDPKLYKKIKKIFTSEKDIVLEVKKLRLRRAGTFIFGEAFIEINPFVGIQDLREELNIFQKKIEELNPYIKDFSIYTHIPKNASVKIAVPLKNGKSLKSLVASSLRETNAYLFARVYKGSIKEYSVKVLKSKDKNPLNLGNFLKKEKVNILIDNKLNSILYYNLRRTHHILIYPNFSDIKTAEDTIKLLLLDT